MVGAQVGVLRANLGGSRGVQLAMRDLEPTLRQRVELGRDSGDEGRSAVVDLAVHLVQDPQSDEDIHVGARGCHPERELAIPGKHRVPVEGFAEENRTRCAGSGGDPYPVDR